MSFLAPLFLAGVAALALPILFHLARRTPRERLRFPSLMFLVPMTPRLTKRSRLEDWLLLALRCLALALLAVGFARPFLKQPDAGAAAGGKIRRTVLLVDRSASLRRTGAWEQVLARVEARVRAAAPADRLAVITFARAPAVLLSFAEAATLPVSDRAAIVRQRLEQTPPGWEGTQLGQGLIAAAEMLTEEPVEAERDGVREIILVSDLQAGARFDALQAFEWPAEVLVQVEPIAVSPRGNAGLQAVAASEEAALGDDAPVRVRVSNSADATTERFRVGWTGPAGEVETGGQVDAYVPAGQSRLVTLPKRPQPGLHRVTLTGDAHDFDNTTWIAAVERRTVSVAYLGSEAAADPRQPLYFLQRALPANARWAFRIDGLRGDLSDTNRLREASWVVASQTPGAAVADALRAEVQAGKSLLLIPRTTEEARAWVGWLGGRADAVREPATSRYAMWGEIDFQHPVFAPFSDPRFGDFTKIHVWSHRVVDPAGLPGARVLARFDTGDPALIQLSLGRGMVWMLTSGWHPADSQLGVSSKFVPLLWSLLETSGVVRSDFKDVPVGEPLPLDPALAITRVVRPDGQVVAIPAGRAAFADAGEPGVYRFQGERGEQRVTVSLDPGETRTEALTPEDLEQRGVRLKAAEVNPAVAALRPDLPAIEAEGRQKLWRWFIGATLLVVAMETVVAARSARRTNLSEGVVP